MEIGSTFAAIGEKRNHKVRAASLVSDCQAMAFPCSSTANLSFLTSAAGFQGALKEFYKFAAQMYSGRFATTTARTGVLAPKFQQNHMKFIRSMLGLCRAQVGGMLHMLAACWAMLSLRCAHVSPQVRHVWPSWPVLGICWAAGPMLVPSLAT